MNQAQKEKAAIKLCELRGIDPYQRVAHGAKPENGVVCDVLLYSQAWQLALREIEQMDAIMTAVEYGRSWQEVS